MIKNRILYKKDKKNTCKTIFIGGFIFKEYEDNRRDQMHWMRSYEAGLLIISNYTHHLHETIIMHHPIYIKKKKKILLTSKFISRCKLLWYYNKQHWYNDGLVLHFMRDLWKECQTTIRIILVCKMWKKKKKFTLSQG